MREENRRSKRKESALLPNPDILNESGRHGQ